MASRVFAAVDLGASSGRVMAGVVDAAAIELHPVHRFENGPREIDGHLRWDLTGLYGEVLTGLHRLAAEFPQVESIGIDTWGIDYGLLDGDGKLVAEPIAHRDDRTTKVVDDVHALVSRDELFEINGLQFLPFTTIYQLAADQRGPSWRDTAHVVLLPDLIAFFLTGALRTERTNASTTGLLDVHTGDWAAALLARLGIAADLLPPLEPPGAIRAPVRPELCRRLGLPASTPVTTVASHDTASAVVGVPATSPNFAYVSSGTWSLVGIEVDAPIVTTKARAANFTNEGGVDGRTRFLRNVGGLWLLQESLRTWAEQGQHHDVTTLIAEAARLPARGPTVDVDDPAFLPPGGMPGRIAYAVEHTGRRPPRTPAETVRCIVDSLAAAYASTLRRASELAARDVDVVHIVGGGAQNALLCRLTADTLELPIVAGPVEATALGNVAVQARAHGAMPASVDELRSQLAACSPPRRFDPS